MKKIILIAILSLVFSTVKSQELTDIQKDLIVFNAEKYIKTIVPNELFLKYCKVNEISLKKDLMLPAIVYSISYSLTTEIYSNSFEIGINSKFDVVERINPYNAANYDSIYLNTTVGFLDLIEKDLIISSEKVHQYMESLYPEKKWGKPTIRQNNFIPYNYYYEIMENDCSTCTTRMIYVDKLEEYKKSESKTIMIKTN